ncbi:hypothetical protein [Flocculibacter collagenilyticus]|uniref:hypothetical protein n=1 Tax=Flocculibacter collagenilyticus TaxID=2744479 RepID=UPI0018F5A443|nr:hypothetical protein [Flocculibacter collagenilyticus]
MNNWVLSAGKTSELKALIESLNDDQRKLVLFKFISGCQEKYQYEILEEVFSYLEILLVEGDDSLVDDEPRIKELIHIGMYEYFLSLNYISEALNIVMNEQSLKTEVFLQATNCVLEAYSCAESSEAFLEREISFLIELLSADKT